ncbi:VIR protein [Plasmodium vivax]|uniref:VIR protein n=1 Tax=Plasmodium vivax TaxID=5855 RepID=A0A1G4ECA2_PLAVI|nr:VIR protein [Plasmodium vivax]
MPDSKSNIDFFNYGNYNRVKSYFESNYELKYDKNILSKIIESINTHPDTKKKLNKIFVELKQYAARGHAFYYCGNEIECCKYINHWLNIKLMENRNIGLSETIFKIFDDFMNNYRKNKADAKCVNKLHYIEPEKVINMRILYNLYDKYTDLKEKKDTKNNPLACTAYDSLIKDYNIFILNYRNKKIDYLDKLLNEFKTIIEDFERINKNNCKKNVELLPPVEPPTLPPETESDKHVVDLSQQEGTTISEGQASHGQESHVLQSQLELNSVQSGHEIATGSLREEGLGKTRSDQILTDTTRETGHSRILENSFGTELRSISVYPLGSNHSNQLMEQLGTNNPSGLPEFPSRDLSANQRDKEGYFSTMADTISGFIKDVDPGPVLSVSGGMGALFLLFKYTPVGSFFGGRRGRIRQIPRSFGGFAPGEFPNFQEYGVGHVRYSPMDIPHLAE